MMVLVQAAGRVHVAAAALGRIPRGDLGATLRRALPAATLAATAATASTVALPVAIAAVAVTVAVAIAIAVAVAVTVAVAAAAAVFVAPAVLHLGEQASLQLRGHLLQMHEVAVAAPAAGRLLELAAARVLEVGHLVGVGSGSGVGLE